MLAVIGCCAVPRIMQMTRTSRPTSSEASWMALLNGDAVAGDFHQYCIVDRVGMTVMYEPMVKDQATARPTGQGSG